MRLFGCACKHLFSMPLPPLLFPVLVKATTIAPGPKPLLVRGRFYAFCLLIMLAFEAPGPLTSPCTVTFVFSCASLSSPTPGLPSLFPRGSAWTSSLKGPCYLRANTMHVKFLLPGIPLLTLPPGWHHSHFDSQSISFRTLPCPHPFPLAWVRCLFLCPVQPVSLTCHIVL